MFKLNVGYNVPLQAIAYQNQPLEIMITVSEMTLIFRIDFPPPFHFAFRPEYYNFHHHHYYYE